VSSVASQSAVQAVLAVRPSVAVAAGTVPRAALEAAGLGLTGLSGAVAPKAAGSRPANAEQL
jgi:hypothetical protein